MLRFDFLLKRIYLFWSSVFTEFELATKPRVRRRLIFVQTLGRLTTIIIFTWELFTSEISAVPVKQLAAKAY